MNFTRVGATAAVTAGVLLAGCGSSNKGLSYSAFSNAANKICITVNAGTSAASKDITNNATAADATALGKVISIETKGISDLKALKGPAALESVRDQFLAKANEGLQDTKDAQTAAKAGNTKQFIADAQKVGVINQADNTLGSKMGAPKCASSD